MIETWILLFLVIYIRNRFVQNLERNNIYLYQQYKIKPFLRHWTFQLPLFMLFLYIIFEILIFNDYYEITKYSNILKSVTLLSYFGLVCQFDLCDSIYDKYKGKGLKAFLTSPFILAISCLCIGYFLNFLAIQANSGHMPVFCDLSFWSGYTNIHSFTEDSFYILGNHNSKMIIFCDIFDLPYSTLSLGDLFCRAYIFFILFFSVKNSNKNLNKLQK